MLIYITHLFLVYVMAPFQFIYPSRPSVHPYTRLWLHRPFLGGRFFSFLIYTVGRTPWMGDQPVSRPLPTHRRNAHNTDIHALSGIRTHDPSVRASETSSYLRPHGHCDRLSVGKFAEGTGYGLYCGRIRGCRVEIRMLILPDTKRECQQLRCSLLLYCIWNSGLTKTTDRNIWIYFNWNNCSVFCVGMALLMRGRHACFKVKLALFSIILGLLPWIYPARVAHGLLFWCSVSHTYKYTFTILYTCVIC
jgi:hypothetical protein